MGIAGDARPVITCVGNLRPVKDHSLLLRACRALRDRGFDYLLLLAGSGPAEERVRREVRDLGLLNQVRFLGERGDIPTVLAATDLFVLTSLWEGLPRSIMEAMASRLAVVSTDAGGVRELVLDGETGYVVSVGDVETLGGRMADLLSDPALRRAMGEAGFQRVKERFTEERMVTAMEAIYREVLGASPSPPTVESTGTPNP
jgi:glycosyltransferase involved in cell wall biosynthesis